MVSFDRKCPTSCPNNIFFFPKSINLKGVSYFDTIRAAVHHLPAMVDHFEWIAKRLQVVCRLVASGAGSAGGDLLASPGDGVPHGVVALFADDLGQDAPPGVDEPVADLSTNKHPC